MSAAFSNLQLSLRLALRNLRGGLKGFGIFLSCMALGVAAIVGVASLSRGLSDGLNREGRAILGADISFASIQQEASPEVIKWLEAQAGTTGTLSHMVRLRAMVRDEAGTAVLAELKAVGAGYPEIRALELTDKGEISHKELTQLLGQHKSEKGMLYGALLDPLLVARLELKEGMLFKLGAADLVFKGEISLEPDRLASGLALGPRVIVSDAGLQATSLVQPGSLVRHYYRLILPEGRNSDADVARISSEFQTKFADAGLEIRRRGNASPQFQQNINRFTQFLSLVGLTALLVGGVGVANAARGFVIKNRMTIATLKSLGAPGAQVFSIIFIQIMLIGALGILLGLVIGASLPFMLANLVKIKSGLPFLAQIYGSELGLGALYGFLIIACFALLPLARAQEIPASTLLRGTVAAQQAWPQWPYLLALVVFASSLIGLILYAALDRRIAMLYLGATFLVFIALRLLAEVIMRVAKRLPRPQNTELRLALIALHKPGTLTPSVLLSLGLGLTLIVALAVIDTSLTQQLRKNLPAQAPNFFFLDVPKASGEQFISFLKTEAPQGKVERTPMLRGRLVALNGAAPETKKTDDRYAWVLEGDRGITFANNVPSGSRLVAGEWWGADYQGAPLVSFGDEVAEGLGLKIGDMITVNVLGRNISARIANLRRIEWQNMGINFVMVFSPNTFASAPYTELLTLALPQMPLAADGRDHNVEREAQFAKTVAKQWPAVSSVRVKESLEAANKLVAQLAVAIRGASAVALLAAILVLSGALSAGQEERRREVVVLKTLGATRPRLLLSLLYEYGILGLIAAAFGILAGVLVGGFVVKDVMKLQPYWPFLPLLIIALVSLLSMVLLGLLSTAKILGEKPAGWLRMA